MSRPEEVRAQDREEPQSELPGQAQSSARLRANPPISDVRSLNSHDTAKGVVAASVASTGMVPPPGDWQRLGELLAGADEQLERDSEILHSLHAGDLPKVIALLLTERRALLLQLEAAREDFEELRRVNVHAQEQLTRALGAADDERISLAVELERAHDGILALEGQLEDSRARSLEELELSQQVRELLEFELLQLRAQLQKV